MSAFLNSGHSDQQNLAVIKVRFRPEAAIRSSRQAVLLSFKEEVEATRVS